MKDLSIKVNIAGRVYPMKVTVEEEENIRKATKAIEEMVKEYEENYAVKDKQDLLAMCALHYATQTMNLSKKTIIEDHGIEDKLQELNELITAKL